MRMFRMFVLASLAALALDAPPARADMMYNMTLDTSALASTPGYGPFAVDFQLNDGSSGDGVGNNTATISNFTLTGGSLTSGTDSPTPGATTGDLTSILTITDSDFFNDFNQQFTPGSQLSFTLDLTTNVSASEGNGMGAPDEFSFAVSSDNFANTASFLTIDITASGLSVTRSGGMLNADTSVPAPTVTPEAAAAAPEPATLSLFALGLATLAAGRAWRRRRGASPSNEDILSSRH